MKFLGDFLPVLLFFVAYFLGESFPQDANTIAQGLLGGVVQDGNIPQDLAPILLASAVAIVAITGQIVWRLVRRRPISPMLWASFIIFLVFGGATIYFHNDAFIKWKPTVLYWIFGIALLVSEVFTGRNLVRAMMEPNGIRMTEQLWQRVNLAWIAFFWVIGCLNLYVAFHMSRSFWVSFKSFGLTGLTFAFVIVQSVILARHIEEQPSESVAEPGPTESSRP